MRAPQTLRNRFSSPSSKDIRQGREAWSRFFASHGLSHVQRMLVYEGRRFVGYVAAHRRVGEAPFGPSDVGSLQRRAPTIRRLLLAACAVEGVSEEAHLVLGARQQVLSACDEAHGWLTSARLQRLTEGVRRVEAGHLPNGFAVEGAFVEVVRLHGGGGTQFLCRLRPTESPLLDAAADLTPSQRGVALLAVEGLTAPEIAAELGRSPETVRSHLKAVYERLQISSRAELAKRLERCAR